MLSRFPDLRPGNDPANLFFVAAEMTELASAAGESLPDFYLEPEDLPAPFGFMAFAIPISSYMAAVLAMRNACRSRP